MNPIETVVAQDLVRLTPATAHSADVIDLDAHLYDYYGLTSLNMMLLMTSVCEKTKTALIHFTEDDIAGLQTPRDIVSLISKFSELENPRVAGSVGTGA
ncbi:phosphopantetheine-binding protein [uncultured Bradyrhizobium sp.]|uniref:phosphopantetheine-binding protein n=1 Tax=uncultured Bradyrhizobium sp. TaxID=199684 RepID=UPI0035CB95CC